MISISQPKTATKEEDLLLYAQKEYYFGNDDELYR